MSLGGTNMLEIIFEDEYDTAAFLHLAEHLDSRHHISIQQGKDRLLIEAKKSGEAIEHIVRTLLIHFFWNAKKMNACAASLKTHTYLKIQKSSTKFFQSPIAS